MSCQRCADLEAKLAERDDELAYLRSELALRVDADHIEAVRRRFVVYPCVARMLIALYQARGRTVTPGQLDQAIPEKIVDERGPFFIRALVFKARQALGPDAVECVRGQGYRLTSSGMALVGAVVDAAPRRAA